MESRWKTVLAIGTILGIFFTLVQGQHDPYIEQFWQNVRRNERGLEKIQHALDESGLGWDGVVDLYRDHEVVSTYLQDKLRELTAAASVRVNPSGDRVYVFDEDTQPRLVSQACVQHVLQFLIDLRNGVYYARRMRSSFGEFSESAEFTYLAKYPGNIWLCKSTKENETSQVPPFDGKSCYTEVDGTFGLGTCWPSSCSESDVDAIFNLLLNDLGQLGVSVSVDCQEPYPWKTADIAFLTTLSFIALLVAIGTFYDVVLQDTVKEKYMYRKIARKASDSDTYANSTSITDTASTSSAEEVVELGTAKVNGGFVNDEKPPIRDENIALEKEIEGSKQKREPEMRRHFGWAILHALLMSFSMYSNCRKLLSAKRSKDMMGVLNGLRTLSMFWVILGHSMQFHLGRFTNPLQGAYYIAKMSFGAIYFGSVCVDTFFVLSGFLVAFMTLKQIEAKRLKSIGSWVMFYFHRWWRLTPVYMAAMGFFPLLLPHFAGEGIKSSPLIDNTIGWCRDRWWTHPLYINNLVPWPNVLMKSCMPWAWYLAVDMQFYIISPFILIILYKNWKAGMALIGSLMLVSLAALFGINWHYGYVLNTQERYNDNVPDPPDADTTYSRPYTRIPTYLIGVVLGYIMFRLKGKKVKMHWLVVILGWMFALGLLFACVYGPWNTKGRIVPQAETVSYLTFSRLAWGVGVCWIIFATLQGYGGPIGVFLSWSFWIPLGRITYCTYLIHPVIIYAKIFTDQVFVHYSYVSFSFIFISNLVLSYSAALVLSLLVEGPTMGLEKVMFGKF